MPVILLDAFSWACTHTHTHTHGRVSLVGTLAWPPIKLSRNVLLNVERCYRPRLCSCRPLARRTLRSSVLALDWVRPG